MNIDSLDFRNALGRFATGVCVISTVSAKGTPLGLTANSFTSVSLDPPLVLWNLQNNSDVYDIFSAPEHFAINVLASEHHGHSNQYAKKGDHLLDPAHFSIGEFGSPIVAEALVTFECELHATYEAGDHLIIVGRVKHVYAREEGEPLLFYSGNYHRLG
tara:strand:- start:65790 stop:66266 length:477 start_codon:yes stop_codon:yes gene_type:complete